MSKPYSLDLRKRAVKYIEQGSSYLSASRRYEISHETVRKWYIRYKAEGHYNQRPRKGKKSSIVQSEFEHYVNSHPSATLAQIGSHFGMTGRSAHYYMKKFGFSYKKKSLATWKQRTANENNT